MFLRKIEEYDMDLGSIKLPESEFNKIVLNDNFAVLQDYASSCAEDDVMFGKAKLRKNHTPQRLDK